MSRRIIKGGAIVADDWSHGTAEAIPDAGDVIVPLAVWRERRGELAGRRVGVRLEPTDDPAQLEGDLNDLPLVAIAFPKFTDGRAFSLARLLRERHGFRGELRAVGDVLRDQLAFMARCGFNAFEVRADKNLEDALNAFTEITVTYQPATRP
ncbi:MAG: DUF934 domain-containing protein [Alphaproteobacteria bacterium]|nr:DUF934 domain-containing protein [Alphaproteobacteria bacterium]